MSIIRILERRNYGFKLKIYIFEDFSLKMWFCWRERKLKREKERKIRGIDFFFFLGK